MKTSRRIPWQNERGSIDIELNESRAPWQKNKRRIVFRTLFGLLATFAVLVGVYLVILDGYKDVTMGRFHREAFDLFNDNDDVYEARIYLIHGEGKQDGTFPIRPYGREEPTYGTVVLTGADLQKFFRVWEHQEVSFWNQSMCHGPVYGFRLYRRGKPVRETSICWSCSNFYINPYPGHSTWYGFRADTKQAKELLAFCDKLMPYRK